MYHLKHTLCRTAVKGLGKEGVGYLLPVVLKHSEKKVMLKLAAIRLGWSLGRTNDFLMSHNGLGTTPLSSQFKQERCNSPVYL
jgi:hypothetical protein